VEAYEKFDEPLRTALAGEGLDEGVALRASRWWRARASSMNATPRSPSTRSACTGWCREVAARRADLRRERMRHTLAVALAAIYPEDGYGNPASWPRCTPLTRPMSFRSVEWKRLTPLRIRIVRSF
jgi:hypothetical protein